MSGARHIEKYTEKQGGYYKEGRKGGKLWGFTLRRGDLGQLV